MLKKLVAFGFTLVLILSGANVSFATTSWDRCIRSYSLLLQMKGYLILLNSTKRLGTTTP